MERLHLDCRQGKQTQINGTETVDAHEYEKQLAQCQSIELSTHLECNRTTFRTVVFLAHCTRFIHKVMLGL